MQNNQLLEAFAQVAQLHLRDPRNIEPIATEIADSLQRFLRESIKSDPQGLWQEIKTLPSSSKELFKKHIHSSFNQAYTDISQSCKTHSAKEILTTLCNSAYVILQGFDNFFTEISQKFPTLTKGVTLALKLALIVTVCVTAPYLSPLAAGILLNSDLILAQVK